MNGTIDTHHHFLPQIYVDAVGLTDLADVMPNRIAPEWSVPKALAIMDAVGIAEAILSISSGPPIPGAATVLRACNEEAAALRAAHPGRFGSFASLPLPQIDSSLREIAYACDTLQADGVILFTNYEGRYLGDPLFAPVLAELDRRGAVAFIHPNHPPYTLSGQPPQSVIEFPFDTTRAAISLIFSGALQNYPNVKFILSHAGGTVPFLSQRIAGALMMNPALAEKIGDPAAAFRRFYYDIALSASPAALACLMQVADPTHILFGSDFPMAPDFAIKATAAAARSAPFDHRANGASLLGRRHGGTGFTAAMPIASTMNPL